MAAVLQGARNRLALRARAWALRRQGTDPAAVTLNSSRLYILPTRAGLLFAVIVFTMLLGAMNYNNNLGFALAFLLAGIGLVSMHHCHHTLNGLAVRALGAAPVFAGEDLQFRFTIENPGRRARWQLALGWDGGTTVMTELEPGEHRSVQLSLPATHRGRITAPRLQVSTRFPLGLFRAWTWVNMDLAGLAYPRPATRANGRATGEPGRRETGLDTAGDDDYAGLRAWRPGDPPRRIAWKILARTGQKMVSEYRSDAAVPRWIDWASEHAPDTEQRIAQLARRVIDASLEPRDYGLRIPGHTINPARGDGHRHDCLRALALVEVPA